MLIKTIHAQINNSFDEAIDSLKKQAQEAFGKTPVRLVIYFSTSNADLNALSAKMQELFHNVDIFGCTTAGEIISGSMLKNSIVAMMFDNEAVQDAKIGVVTDIKENGNVEDVYHSFEQYYGDLSQVDLKKFIGIILIDGMSGAEERIMDKLGNLTNITFVGASAGDDLKFKQTSVFVNGKTYSNAAVLALLKLGVEYDILKTQSFQSSNIILEATKVDEKERIIEEFNHKPAITAYAQSLGATVEQARNEFMSHPVGLMINDEPYIRSPQQLVGTHMKFYCNVKEGAKLHVFNPTDIVEETKKAIARKESESRHVSAIINFHCILRTLELEKNGQMQSYANIFTQIPTIGFSTYGEEYIGHMNQTSTMLVFK